MGGRTFTFKIPQFSALFRGIFHPKNHPNFNPNFGQKPDLFFIQKITRFSPRFLDSFFSPLFPLFFASFFFPQNRTFFAPFLRYFFTPLGALFPSKIQARFQKNVLAFSGKVRGKAELTRGVRRRGVWGQCGSGRNGGNGEKREARGTRGEIRGRFPLLFICSIFNPK